MLEYLYLAGGKGGLDLSAWQNLSLTASLAILNGLFLFLYVIFKIAGGGPTSGGLVVAILLVMVGANLMVIFMPEVSPVLRSVMARF